MRKHLLPQLLSWSCYHTLDQRHLHQLELAKLIRDVAVNHGITEYLDEHSSGSEPQEDRYLSVPSSSIHSSQC